MSDEEEVLRTGAGRAPGGRPVGDENTVCSRTHDFTKEPELVSAILKLITCRDGCGDDALVVSAF